MPPRNVVVRMGLGMVLLATAGLKVFGLSNPSVPRAGWFAQPWVQLLTAEWELLLGAWLLSGRYPWSSWLVAFVTFITFAGVSAHLGLVGVASCGCLGTVQTNPWWVFAGDLLILALLGVSRPRTPDAALRRAFTQPYGAWVGTVAVVCGVLVGVGSLAFGSVEAVVAKLRGETLWVPPYTDFGSGKPGESLQTSIPVANWTNTPLRLLGGTADCTCVTAEDFPLVIPPNSKASFRVRLNVIADTGGQFTRSIVVRTDDPARPQFTFQIGCRVLP